MAAPKRNRSHPDDPAFEKTRAKIQTTQLVKRLENYALNNLDEQGKEVELEPQRIRAIEILLNKTLPNLQSTEISGKDGGPIVPVLQIFEIEAKVDDDTSTH